MRLTLRTSSSLESNFIALVILSLRTRTCIHNNFIIHAPKYVYNSHVAMGEIEAAGAGHTWAVVADLHAGGSVLYGRFP